MLLDIILLVLVILAVIKGYQRGLIIGVFSFIAIIIGLAAAMKLSTIVAGYLGNTVTISAQWLPVISFAIVFILAVMLIRWGANLLEKTAEVALLGWVNKIGGMLLYLAIYILVYSIVLFYATEIKLLQSATIEQSATYSLIQPWGPKAVNSFGTIIPVFKDMFTDLETFFEGIAQKAAA
jgi:membrane protein required for colicin V production